jgi:hypothetical protein
VPSQLVESRSFRFLRAAQAAGDLDGAVALAAGPRVADSRARSWMLGLSAAVPCPHMPSPFRVGRPSIERLTSDRWAQRSPGSSHLSEATSQTRWLVIHLRWERTVGGGVCDGGSSLVHAPRGDQLRRDPDSNSRGQRTTVALNPFALLRGSLAGNSRRHATLGRYPAPLGGGALTPGRPPG